MNDDTARSKRVRTLLGVLAVIPLGLLADRFFVHVLSNSTNWLGLLILGVPILALNYWAWFLPEIFEGDLFRNKSRH